MSEVIKYLDLKDPFEVISDPSGYKKGTELLFAEGYEVFYKDASGNYVSLPRNFKFTNNIYFEDVKFKFLGKTPMTFYCLKKDYFDTSFKVDKNYYRYDKVNAVGSANVLFCLNTPGLTVHYTGYKDCKTFLESDLKQRVSNAIRDLGEKVLAPMLLRNNSNQTSETINYDLSDGSETSRVFLSMLKNEIEIVLDYYLKTPVVVFDGITNIEKYKEFPTTLLTNPLLPLFNGDLSIMSQALYKAKNNDLKGACELIYKKALYYKKYGYKEGGQYILNNVVNPIIAVKPLLKKESFADNNEAKALNNIYCIGLNVFYSMNILENSNISKSDAPTAIIQFLYQNYAESTLIKRDMPSNSQKDLDLSMGLVDAIRKIDEYKNNIHLLDKFLTDLGFNVTQY